MTVEELIQGLPVTPSGSLGAEVTGVTHDSRRVRPGDVFVATIGERHDGRAFVPEALGRGAVAVVAAGPPPPAVQAPWLQAREPRALLAPLAARVYGHPHREMLVAGVTGTNGKSTVVHLLAALLERAGRPTGVLGTLGYHFRSRQYHGERTTPEASDLFRILRQMRQEGAAAAAMEVSSHALAMGRVNDLTFDLALFTNLSRDHFDFHRDYEDYFSHKRRLFQQRKEGGKAVVNVDDPYGRRLAAALPGAVTFGASGDVRVAAVELDEGGIRGRLETPRGPLPFRSPLLGRYNVENLAAAAAAAEALELPREAVAEAFAASGPLPGRMEPVEGGQSFPVLVDYAHTDAALEAALRSVRELSGRKVIVVFGCGGDRDPGKRSLMGRVAGELAELPIVTSDNPRREDPMAIIGAVEEGLRQSRNRTYRVIPDRREAIRQAIALADAGWAVLIAGKGHEERQIVGRREIPFSDRREALAALERRLGSTTNG